MAPCRQRYALVLPNIVLQDTDVKFDEVSQAADVTIDQGSMSESGVVTEDQSKVDVSSEEGSYDVIKHKGLFRYIMNC